MREVPLVNIIDQYISEHIECRLELHPKLWLEIHPHSYTILGRILRNETLVITTLVQLNLAPESALLSTVDPATEEVTKSSFLFCDPQFPDNAYEAINSWAGSWEVWFDLYNESIRKRD